MKSKLFTVAGVRSLIVVAGRSAAAVHNLSGDCFFDHLFARRGSNSSSAADLNCRLESLDFVVVDEPSVAMMAVASPPEEPELTGDSVSHR